MIQGEMEKFAYNKKKYVDTTNSMQNQGTYTLYLVCDSVVKSDKLWYSQSIWENNILKITWKFNSIINEKPIKKQFEFEIKLYMAYFVNYNINYTGYGK